MTRMIPGVMAAAMLAGLLSARADVPYEFMKPDSAVSKQADEWLAKMTLDEKIGQMVQADLNALKDRGDVTKFFLGSVLSGGGSDPSDNQAATWAKVYDDLQARALATRLKLPILYGIDAVHGNNNILGATIFPHNIGLGATRNPDLVEKAARAT